MKMEALVFSKTSLLFYQTTGRHISDCSSLHIHRHDNLYCPWGGESTQRSQVRNTSSLDTPGYFVAQFRVVKMEAEISSEALIPNDRGIRLHRNIDI
jgi:hypothetical protein